MIYLNENKGGVFTVDDLTEYLSIGKTTAYNLLKSKKIKAIRIGKLYRIPKKAVDEYLETNRK